MEASVRICNSINLNRHISRSILTKHSLNLPLNQSSLIPSHSSRFTICSPSNNLLPSNLYGSTRIKCVSRFSSPSPISNQFSFLSLSAAQLFGSHVSDRRLDRVGLDPKESHFSWNRAPVDVNGEDLGVSREKGPVLAVVMLGWLGAEQKHLKRYIELYTSKGIHALSFVVPVRDILGFDLGRRVDRRILALTEELVSWLSETEEDGRERGLLFHTFSNTGWLAYGAILNYLQSRGEYMDKIRGCVIDSGGDPELDPQVWAAGFAAALLKKRSSAAVSSFEATGHKLQTDNGISKVQDTKPLLVEILLRSVFEKFFSFILKLPDVNRRLTKITTTLSMNQPLCPQLYLYSTDDRVIPSGQVEMFIQTQKVSGRKVWAHNFGSSPHVDHYRSFPHDYSAELHRFLESVAKVK